MCPDCGKNLVIKLGLYGKFYGCTGYPQCRYIRSLNGQENQDSNQDNTTEEKCEKCDKPMVIKEGRYGKFLACSGYPQCKSVKSLNKVVQLGIKCPDCGDGDIVEKKTRRGKLFYGCSGYPKCTFATWNKPRDEPCPLCEYPILVEKETKKDGKTILCAKKECTYKKKATDE